MQTAIVSIPQEKSKPESGKTIPLYSSAKPIRFRYSKAKFTLALALSGESVSNAYVEAGRLDLCLTWRNTGFTTMTV